MIYVCRHLLMDSGRAYSKSLDSSNCFHCSTPWPPVGSILPGSLKGWVDTGRSRLRPVLGVSSSSRHYHGNTDSQDVTSSMWLFSNASTFGPIQEWSFWLVQTLLCGNLRFAPTALHRRNCHPNQTHRSLTAWFLRPATWWPVAEDWSDFPLHF